MGIAGPVHRTELRTTNRLEGKRIITLFLGIPEKILIRKP
jgi:hypothetical protein